MDHEVTAETLRPSQVACIRKEALLVCMAKHPEAYPAAVKSLLGGWLASRLRTVALSASLEERLAKLLRQVARKPNSVLA